MPQRPNHRPSPLLPPRLIPRHHLPRVIKGEQAEVVLCGEGIGLEKQKLAFFLEGVHSGLPQTKLSLCLVSNELDITDERALLGVALEDGAVKH